MDVRDEVRDLLSRAPRAPEDSIPQGVSDDTLRRFEERVGMPVPQTLRDWLRLANGARIGPGGLFGIDTRKSLDIENYLREYPEWRENRWLPVAGDGTGNYYVLVVGRDDGCSPVFFVDTHEDPAEPAYIVGSDLWQFLRFLLRKECGDRGWPFSRDKVVMEDPAITLYDDVPQPWGAYGSDYLISEET
jgi:hypothetical protein